MKAWARWLVGAVLAVSGAAWGADMKELRLEYFNRLNRFEEGRGSLERVFESGQAAARAVLEESIRRAEAAKEHGTLPLKPQESWLPGFRVSVEEAYVAVPDTRFFRDLARKRGTPVDKELFELFHRTYWGDALWRVYMIQQTDVSGCYVFDHPDLVDLYRNWTRFWATHPRAYTQLVEREVKFLEDMVAQRTCACGDRASVETGLERFLKSFPRSPVAPDVRARLERVRAGTSDFRFRCTSG
jgi:hypothetical protein